MTDNRVLFSFCVVAFKARDLLRDCLSSLYQNPPTGAFEIVVVDNHSEDGTLEMLAEQFPQVTIITNPSNNGYTAPMNQALRRAAGTYLVQLNPDTLVLPGTFDRMHEFMQAHPEVGICTPKVLNRDGTLQKPCRRSAARPWDVLSYFLGLSRLFPKSRFFGGYQQTFRDENETHPVEAVSGSVMVIRRAVVEQIGYLDERYFAYQEDTDFCVRAGKAGWKVYYVPTGQIVHFGGEGGSKVQPFRSVLAWHKSYFQYYRKNLAHDYIFLFNWLYYLAMLVKLGIALLLTWLNQGKFSRKA